MSNRRKPKSPGYATHGGPHEPSAWMREQAAVALERLRNTPFPLDDEGFVAIGFLTPNGDDVCDRCGGDSAAGGGPHVGFAQFYSDCGRGEARFGYGLCGLCWAKEGRS